MIAVCIWWNTEADGSTFDQTGVDLDDWPKSYYGPFDTLQDAIDWMRDDYPDDDTDVHDMIADVFDIPLEHVNDPSIINEEYVGPVPREIQGS